ncbi:MAG: DNA-binding protein WhiA [Candidatus Coproplasma sp.]
MSNFTEEIKNEIIENSPESDCCRLALLSAFIRTSGSIVSRAGEYGFELVTENSRTADYLCDLLEHNFNITLSAADAKFDPFTGRDKLTFECVNSDTADLLCAMKIIKKGENGVSLTFGIDEKLIEKDCCKAAYLKGAFLGGGSCTLPDEGTYSRTGYHFEVTFSNRITASDFCDLLCDFEVLAKLVSRKDSAVVYVKSKEVISDILYAMSAEESLEKLNKIVELKDRVNNGNRVANCSASNIDKTVTASVAQIRSIEIIRQTVGLKKLPPILFEVAEARLADPNASMQELADRLKITKSCINHRMRKIAEIANQLS